MAIKNGTTMTKNRLPQLALAWKNLPRKDVLVGYPADGKGGSATGSNLRTEGVGGSNVAISELTNAQIAYIHENGAPEINLPARPHLIPGVREGRDRYVPHLKKSLQARMEGDGAKADRHLEAAGQIAADAVRTKIRSGPFAPLAPSTIAARRRRSKGSSYRRKAQTAAEVTPLIDTAQMLRAVTHVVRTKS